ncbi:hypothetical protein CLRAG_33610 [Clostridium ragsdalei P11]|uniref:Uncharacterized protein n=1 Tax=Clostridium ragsdalei P11 TaxID=1353534 RepID=A0A1A6AL46_9CLOT|nr:hypothetical protein [Clostridium ragsdalei]OBR90713.1 hypothetical protein CLRAG_33610 [Clostridium ragsdalei P11]
MNKYIEQIPKWWTEEGEYDLCLSDDIDSLMSCYYLSLYKKWNIKYFYDFYKTYKSKDYTGDKLIGVDMDILKGRCLGNHVVYNDNENCINLNRFAGIGFTNYTKKFAGNSIITVLSLLNISADNFTQEQLEILLAIDTMFKSYYFDKDIAKYYISDVLGYPQLIHILEKHTQEYFYRIMDEYSLYSDIKCKDGYLHTNIKLKELKKIFNIRLELPKQEFFVCQEFKQGKGIPINNTNLFSFARTYRNSGIYSYYI